MRLTDERLNIIKRMASKPCKDVLWHKEVIVDMLDTIEALQQENEHLNKQIVTSDMILKEYSRNIVDYLEALAKVREALEHLSLCDCNFNCEDCPADYKLCSIHANGEIVEEALAVIDKAVGE